MKIEIKKEKFDVIVSSDEVSNKLNGNLKFFWNVAIKIENDIFETQISNAEIYQRKGAKIIDIESDRIQKKLQSILGAPSSSHVYISISEDVYEKLKTHAENEINKHIENEKAKKISYWEFCFDERMIDLFLYPYGTENEIIDVSARQDIQHKIALLQKINYVELVEKAEKIKDARWKISNEKLNEIIDIEVEKEKQKELEKENKIKEQKEKEKEAFRKARETGEKQLLQKTYVDCNDENEECNTDILYVYAMSDGNTKTERYHTW